MNNKSGLTLVEFLVVIAIVGILFVAGGSGLFGFVSSNKTTAADNRLVANLSYTRSEAVTLARNVSICASNNQVDINTFTVPCIAANATDPDILTAWNTAWIIFVDNDGDGVIDAADNDEILRVEDVSELNVTVGQNLANPVHSLCYNLSGEQCGNGTAVTFTVSANGETRSIAARASGSIASLGSSTYSYDEQTEDDTEDSEEESEEEDDET